MIADTSLQAYKEKDLQPLELKVLSALRKGGAMTNKELQKETGLALSSVCGRVNALHSKSKIICLGKKKDKETGLPHKVWKSSDCHIIDLKQLLDDVRPYMKHFTGCDLEGPGQAQVCSCGYHDIIRRIKEVVE